MMTRISCFLFLVCLTSGFAYAQVAKKQPNIIIVLADDLGWGDVGFHGSEIQTPNLDRLAKEGAVLNHFYTAPVCSPTRAGLMTGRYPNRFGLRETVIPPWSDFGVDVSEQFLPQYLAEAGYTNRAAIGKWHLGHSSRKYLPLEKGFNHFYGHYNGAIDYFTHEREGELDWHNDRETSHDRGYSTDLISEEAVKCIKSYSAQSSPFLLYVAYNAPHTPLQAKKEDLLLYGYDESKPSFGEKSAEDKWGSIGRGNTKRQTYSAMVTAMDRGIGKMMNTLKDLNIEQNTIVLFFSDNGADPGNGSSGMLRGHKFQEWEGGVRSPAVVRWPQVIAPGTRVDQLMGYVDIVPTLMAIAGAESVSHKPFDGQNMVSLLKGNGAADRAFYLGYGSLIKGHWKIVKANAGNNGMKLKSDALFDLKNDPSEKMNVKTEHPEVYQEMLRLLAPYDRIQSEFKVPPYGQGKNGFKAPKDWVVEH